MKSLFIFLISIQSGLLFSQSDTVFHKVFYENNLNMRAKACATTLEDGLIISGNLDQNGYLLKIDSAGTILWNRKVENQSEIKKVLKTSDSSFLLVGNQFNLATQKNDLLVAKFNNDGLELWSRTYNLTLPLSFDGKSAIEDNNRDYLICGSITPNSKSFLCKISKDGDLLFSRTFNVGNVSSANGITIDPNGSDSSIFVTGVYSEVAGSNNSYLGRFDNDGYPVSVSGIQYVELFDILFLNSKLYFLGVHSSYVTQLCTTLDGQVIWMRDYFTFSNYLDDKMHLHQTSENNLISIAGDQYFNTRAMETDATGNIIYFKNVMMDGVDIIETQKSGYFIVGYGPLFGVKILQSDHVGVIRMDNSFGPDIDCLYQQNTTTNVFSPNQESPTLTVIDGILATNNPTTFVSENILDFVGCVEMLGKIDEFEVASIEVFPIPANEFVRFVQEDNLSFTIRITDITGRLIFTSQKVYGETTVDTSYFPQGSYTYSIIFENNQIKKGNITVVH